MMAADPPLVTFTIAADSVKAGTAAAKSSDGKKIETSFLSSSMELFVDVNNPADLEVLTVDTTFESNLKTAVAETLKVYPKTVTITSVLVGSDGKLEVSYDVTF